MGRDDPTAGPAADVLQAECTPGYYNNEGKPRPVSQTYGPGPVAFHDLLRRWRTQGGLDEVLAGNR